MVGLLSCTGLMYTYFQDDGDEWKIIMLLDGWVTCPKLVFWNATSKITSAIAETVQQPPNAINLPA